MHTALINQLIPSLFYPNSPRYFPAYSVIFYFCFIWEASSTIPYIMGKKTKLKERNIGQKY